MKNKFYLKAALIIVMTVIQNTNGFGQTNYFAGYYTGTNNTGNNCTGVGSGCLTQSNSGNNNSAFGCAALWHNGPGYGNSGFGTLVLAGTIYG
jgi:hypothetical protein